MLNEPAFSLLRCLIANAEEKNKYQNKNWNVFTELNILNSAKTTAKNKSYTMAYLTPVYEIRQEAEPISLFEERFLLTKI